MHQKHYFLKAGNFLHNCDGSESMLDPHHVDQNESRHHNDTSTNDADDKRRQEDTTSNDGCRLFSSVVDDKNVVKEKTTSVEEETIRKVSTKLKVLLPSSKEVEEEKCKKTKIEDPTWIFCSVQGCGFWTKKPERMSRHKTCHIDEVKQSFQCPGK